LQKAASNADAVYLAGDPDREGEAICAHLAEVLSGPKLEFPTEEEKEKEAANGNGKKGKKKAKKPVKKAVAKGKPVIARKNIFPRDVQRNHAQGDQGRVRASRRNQRKSGGRAAGAPRAGPFGGLQNFAAAVGQGAPRTFRRPRADRRPAPDRRSRSEIRAFVPVEYWTIHAILAAGEPPAFEAKLNKYKGEDIESTRRRKRTPSWPRVGKAQWKVASVTQKEKRRFAPPPFTTSKLQQAAYNRLRYTAKRTMGLAQRLYEGVELGRKARSR
jgi:DNA topoisomerase-1